MAGITTGDVSLPAAAVPWRRGRRIYAIGLTGRTGRGTLDSMKLIAAYEAKSRFSELLREAAAGEVFIITRNGQRMAELRACQSEKPPRKRGMMKSDIPPIPSDFNEPLDIFAEYRPRKFFL